VPRIRSIKPEFWTDYRLARDLTRDQRMFYIGLWNEADDEGRFMAHPRRLLGAIFPYEHDLTEGSVSDSLRALAATGRLVVYEVDGEPYGQLVKFHDHQRINRPTPSRIPAPDKAASILLDDSVRAHGGLSEGSPLELGARSVELGARSRELVPLCSPSGDIPPPLILEPPRPKRPKADPGPVVALWRELCVPAGMPDVSPGAWKSKATKAKVARAAEDIDDTRQLFERASKAPWLTGSGDFVADMLWVLGTGRERIEFGRYDPKAKAKEPGSVPPWESQVNPDGSDPWEFAEEL